MNTTRRSGLGVRVGLWVGVALMVWSSAGCVRGEIGDERDQGVGYRNGSSVADNSEGTDGDSESFTSNGERGQVLISEINWAGSISDDGVYDPDDIFIEFQNRHARPIYLTGWQLTVEAGTNHPVDADLPYGERFKVTIPMPERLNGQPIGPSEYVVIAKKADGAFGEVADYILPDLHIPLDFFRIELRDVDDRLNTDAGSRDQEVFAGGYDFVTVRSMERVQLLFANQGGREASWHTYSYNVTDEEHAERTRNIREGYREHTFASPGLANSPDYSGNTSSGADD